MLEPVFGDGMPLLTQIVQFISIEINWLVFQGCNPDVATYYTNRALCYLKLKKWDQACQDCQRALETNPNLIKGYYFQGQALLEMNLYDESISSLMRG